MKPNEARAMMRRQEQARAARGRALEEFLEGDGDRQKVQPDLIPDSTAATVALRDVRKLIRQAERTPRGPRRGKLLDELICAMARLVFVERVMAMDQLERAGLTPARLVMLSKVGPEDLRARLALFQGEGSKVEVPR